MSWHVPFSDGVREGSDLGPIPDVGLSVCVWRVEDRVVHYEGEFERGCLDGAINDFEEVAGILQWSCISEEVDPFYMEFMLYIKVNDVDGLLVCIILIYSHNGQPIYIIQVTLIRV